MIPTRTYTGSRGFVAFTHVLKDDGGSWMLLEKAKSATLVVLFVICAYLAGQYLLDTRSIGAQTSSPGTLVSVNIEDLLNPQGYQVSFGGGLYSGTFASELRSSLWENAKGLVRIALESPAYTEMDQKSWDQAVVQRGVSLRLPFPMTADQILAASGSSSSRDLLGNAQFTVIFLPTGSSGTVWLGKPDEFKYLKFVSSAQSTDLLETVSRIERASATIEYKRLEDSFSLRRILEKPDQVYSENHIIEPIVKLPFLDRVRVSNEFNLQSLSEEQERQYADIAFGARFDFVKRVREVDGSVVYLYGYGDRALRFGVQGTLEYQERFAEGTASGTSPSFTEGLKIAVSELSKYGNLPEGFYLKGFSESEDSPGLGVKRYYFGYRYMDLPIYMSPQDQGYAAVVELTNSQVTHLKKNFKVIQRVLPIEELSLKVLSMDELIEQHYDLILDDYLKFNPEAEAFKNEFGFVYQIIHDISVYEPGYVLSKENGTIYYEPVWHLGIGSNHYYFDLYNGGLLQRDTIEAVR
jgi:hypothetical protein